MATRFQEAVATMSSDMLTLTSYWGRHDQLLIALHTPMPYNTAARGSEPHPGRRRGPRARDVRLLTETVHVWRWQKLWGCVAR